MNHTDKHNILYKMQHGFRKKLSCETFDSGQQTDCLTMDFSKAFDKVSHSLLIHKLEQYGIKGKTSAWIKGFLSDRTQCVVIEGEKSDIIKVESGVPQRSVLGPSLFLFYINDMPDNITSTVRLLTPLHTSLSDHITPAKRSKQASQVGRKMDDAVPS